MPICQVRVVQRTRIQLEGEVTGPDTLSGALYSESDKVVLSASSDLCASGDVGESLGNSRFVLVRLTGRDESSDIDTDADGVITCEEIRAQGNLGGLVAFSRSEPTTEHCIGGPE